MTDMLIVINKKDRHAFFILTFCQFALYIGIRNVSSCSS